MSRDEILVTLTSIFRNAFIDDSLVIKEETCAADIKEWDSLMQITLITAIESEYNVQFSLDDVLQLKNVGDMIELILRETGNA